MSAAPSMKLIQELQDNQAVGRVAGIDEVGRGSLAGPLVAAAVILPPTCRLPGVRDSKVLSPRTRERLASLIRHQALAIGVGWVAAEEIDRHGLASALALASRRALADCNVAADFAIIDGKVNYLADHLPSRAVVAADSHCLPVAAAAIVAKVARDRYMRQMDRLLPDYLFASNVGYGTAAHRAALAQAGASWLHRRSFAPLRQLERITEA